MSQFLPEQFKEQETKKTTTPQQGPEAYLSPEERRFWQRFTSFPEELHPDFRSWLIDFIAVNIPQIPISQITGFNQVEQVEANFNQVGPTGESTGSTSYTDLSTAGPSLSGLRDGNYIVQFGCDGINTGGEGRMAISVNGAAAADSSAVVFGSTLTTGCAARNITLSSGTNTITAKYRATAGSAFFQYRWILAQRIGPVPAS